MNSCTEVESVIQECEPQGLAGIGDPSETAVNVASAEVGLWVVAETILLVEDEAFVRKVAAEVLQSAGYRLLIARSAPEALETYRKFTGQIDLLLADVVMPGMSGRELATKFSNLDPHTRVLLMSGYAEQLARCDLSPHGQFLAKPFSTRMLLQRVREVLDANPFDLAAPA